MSLAFPPLALWPLAFFARPTSLAPHRGRAPAWVRAGFRLRRRASTERRCIGSTSSGSALDGSNLSVGRLRRAFRGRLPSETARAPTARSSHRGCALDRDGLDQGHVAAGRVHLGKPGREPGRRSSPLATRERGRGMGCDFVAVVVNGLVLAALTGGGADASPGRVALAWPHPGQAPAAMAFAAANGRAVDIATVQVDVRLAAPRTRRRGPRGRTTQYRAAARVDGGSPGPGRDGGGFVRPRSGIDPATIAD